MTGKGSKEPAKTAGQLQAELAGNPSYQAEILKKESDRKERVAQNRKAEAPLVEALQHKGLRVNSIADLFLQRMNYRDALPILIRWLPKIRNHDVKEDVVRALTVKWARPQAAIPLIREFIEAPDSEAGELRWAIANALETVADDSVFDELAALALDKRFGLSRQMLALALGNMRNPRALEVLLELLDDDEIAGHAVMGLGRLKAEKAVPNIEVFLSHPKAWVRKEAERALRNISESLGKA